ncbi:MAG: aldolase/citrate lyase family protein [Pseudomonadota bacterium]
MDSFRKRLLAGEVLTGAIITLPSPEMAEMFSLLGFDWLFVDAEHSAMGPSEVQAILQAADSRCPCLVRVPSQEEAWIKKVLDMGPSGIIFPLVSNGEEASRLLSLCRYPPRGRRSVGMGRAHGYGPGFVDYMARADSRTAVVFQVETREGVANADAIAQAGGDALFVGPYDLSASMGKTGQVEDPEVLSAIGTAYAAAKSQGLPAGIFGADAHALRGHLKAGFTLLAMGTDCLYASASALHNLSMLRS